MNKPLSTHDSTPLRDCGLLNDECRSKGYCQGHSEPLSTQSPSDGRFTELSAVLEQYQTMREFHEHSPTAYASLVHTLLRREDAAKQREVDLTVVNLINKGLFTPGELAIAFNNITIDLQELTSLNKGEN